MSKHVLGDLSKRIGGGKPRWLLQRNIFCNNLFVISGKMDQTLTIFGPPVLHSCYEPLKLAEKGSKLMISASASDALQLTIKNMFSWCRFYKLVPGFLKSAELCSFFSFLVRNKGCYSYRNKGCYGTTQLHTKTYSPTHTWPKVMLLI